MALDSIKRQREDLSRICHKQACPFSLSGGRPYIEITTCHLPWWPLSYRFFVLFLNEYSICRTCTCQFQRSIPSFLVVITGTCYVIPQIDSWVRRKQFILSSTNRPQHSCWKMQQSQRITFSNEQSYWEGCYTPGEFDQSFIVIKCVFVSFIFLHVHSMSNSVLDIHTNDRHLLSINIPKYASCNMYICQYYTCIYVYDITNDMEKSHDY